jgi:uncharacterized protein
MSMIPPAVVSYDPPVQTVADILASFWGMMAEMGPWLVIGFAVAGVLSVVVKPVWVERHLGRPGVGSVVKASVLGVPLPLCSCGVIPVGASLYRHGASRGASASFLISTPQTGVDSIAATYALLGPVFAVVRPVVALVSGIIGGLFVDAVSKHQPRPAAASASNVAQPEAAGPVRERAVNAARYGFVTLPADIVWALVVGIVVAALVTVFVPAGTLAAYLGGGFVAMLIAATVGLPVYVCSVGAIPLALGLMHVGASPGAALAFMVAGPATNAATVGVTFRVLGARAGLAYVTTVVVAAVLAGLALDAAGGALGLASLHPDTHLHEHGLTITDHVWAAGLSGIMLAAMWTRYGSRLMGSAMSKGSCCGGSCDTNNRPGDPVQALTGTRNDAVIVLDIEGMTCSHCSATVHRTLTEFPGVKAADVQLANKRAVVEGEALDAQKLAAAVEALGYSAKAAGR